MAPPDDPAAAATQNPGYFLQTVKLPKFGDTDKILPRDFLLMVDEASKTNSWTSEQTAANVILALEGRALTWIRGIKEQDAQRSDETKIATNWERLHREFIKRFAPAQTTVHKRAILRKLQMTNEETPQDFYDRCIVQMYALKEHVPTAERTQGWIKSFEDEILLAFLGGLKEEIRTKLEEDPSLATKDRMLETATAIYNAHDTTKPQTTAALAQINKDKEREIAELSTRVAQLQTQYRGQPRFQRGFRGRNSSFRGRGRFPRRGFTTSRGTTTPSYSRGPIQNRGRGFSYNNRGRGQSVPNDTCFKCSSKGHWARNCPVESVQPTSTPNAMPQSSTQQRNQDEIAFLSMNDWSAEMWKQENI